MKMEIAVVGLRGRSSGECIGLLTYIILQDRVDDVWLLHLDPTKMVHSQWSLSIIVIRGF